jgi:hypothetical protein
MNDWRPLAHDWFPRGLSDEELARRDYERQRNDYLTVRRAAVAKRPRWTNRLRQAWRLLWR